MKGTGPSAYSTYEVVQYNDADFDSADVYIPDDGLILFAIWFDGLGGSVEMKGGDGTWDIVQTPAGDDLDGAQNRPVPCWIACDGVNIRITSDADNQTVRFYMAKLVKTS